MKKIILLFGLIVLMSCEKTELSCYECKTYLNDEMLFKTVSCGLTKEDVHTLRIGMETEAWMILGYDAKVICKEIIK
jgi:hypothetical protein